jgi:hypothetical protein
MTRIAESELIHLFLNELLSQSEESAIKLKRSKATQA